MLVANPREPAEHRQPPDRAPLLRRRIVDEAEHVVGVAVVGGLAEDLEGPAPVVAGADDHNLSTWLTGLRLPGLEVVPVGNQAVAREHHANGAQQNPQISNSSRVFFMYYWLSCVLLGFACTVGNPRAYDDSMAVLTGTWASTSVSAT